MYEVGEGQFRRSFEESRSHPGNTGENLLALLERRPDNVVYRLGFARSRPMARQLVAHGHVRVEGQRVTIPSFRVEEGQRIERPIAGWLEREGAAAAGRIARLPQRSDVEQPIDERLITSFYSR